MNTKHGIDEKIIAIGHSSANGYKAIKYLARVEDKQEVINLVSEKQQANNEYFNISTKPYKNDPARYVWIIEG